MWTMGWKPKAEKLKMVILSGAHSLAKELPAGLERILEIFRHAVESHDASGLMAKIDDVPKDPTPILWEPARIHGWHFQATLYRKDGELWWLVHVSRTENVAPSDKDVAFLEKVLEVLGAQPRRHAIIAPWSPPPGFDPVPFGWWTWKNTDQLYDIQIKGHGKKAEMRIVPLGSRETDGFESLDKISAKLDAAKRG